MKIVQAFNLFVLFCSVIRGTISVKTDQSLLESLKKFEIVTLKQFEDYHHLNRKNVLTTKLYQMPGFHIPDAHFSINYERKTYDLDLYLNNELLPASFMTSTYTKNNDFVMHKPTPEETNHCYYHGHVRNIEESQVIASTCQGLRGVVVLPDDILVIEPLRRNATLEHDHVIYRARDVRQPAPGSCGNKDGTPGVETLLNQLKSFSDSSNMTSHRRRKRQANAERKFVELMIVADSLEARKYPNRIDLEARIKELANYVDGFYQKLGIRIVLTHIEVWSNRDRTSLSSDAQRTLDSFTAYRERRRATEPSTSPWVYADNIHLLYGGDFQGSTIGMASVGTMCSPQSVGVNQDHSSKLMDTAATVAHEMGHNFGMQHDSPGCSCPGSSKCIMASSSGYADSRDWSSCSRSYLDQNLQMGLKSCLLNVPEPSRIYGGPRCGNEIVEKGEECDCGEPGFCTSSCCDPRTCRLLDGAQCDAGLCCNDCKMLPAGTLCRGTDNNKCELPEYCTGASPYCPADYYKEDGTLCLEGTATCYEGVCLTHTMQCRNIWGPTAANGDELCYVHVNAAGNQNGNCGRDSQGQFIKCSEGNAMCGKLQCAAGATRPIIGSGRSTYTNEITVGFKTARCRTVGSDPINSDILDPGLVRSGTRCADGKVCLEGICQSIPKLTCSAKCNGNGVCNNVGHCHCNSGWAPPFCVEEGTGGSQDSGPKPSQTPVAIIVVIVLAVLVLLIGAALLAWCICFRGRTLKKPKWMLGRDTHADATFRNERNKNDVLKKQKSPSQENILDSAQGSPVRYHQPTNNSDHFYSTIPSYDIHRAAPPPPTFSQSRPTPPQAPKSKPPLKPSELPPTNPAPSFKPFQKPPPPMLPFANPTPKPLPPSSKPVNPPKVPLSKPMTSPATPPTKPSAPPFVPSKPKTPPVAPLNKPTPPPTKPGTSPIVSSNKPKNPPNIFSKPKPAPPLAKPQTKPLLPGNKPISLRNEVPKPLAKSKPPHLPLKPVASVETEEPMSVMQRARMFNAT